MKSYRLVSVQPTSTDGSSCAATCCSTAELSIQSVRSMFYLMPTMTSLVFPQDSQAVGLIILERCQVEADNESGNRNAFKLGKAAMAACLACRELSLLVSV